MYKISQVRFFGDGDERNYPAGITQAQLNNKNQGLFNNAVHMLNIAIEAPVGTNITVLRKVKIYNELHQAEIQTREESYRIDDVHPVDGMGKYECYYTIPFCWISFTNDNALAPLLVTFTYEDISEEEAREYEENT
jgi:hypothetical protein